MLVYSCPEETVRFRHAALWSCRIVVNTPACHAGNRSSILRGTARRINRESIIPPLLKIISVHNLNSRLRLSNDILFLKHLTNA